MKIERFASWQHQADAFDFIQKHPDAVMLDMGMGSGKSKVLVDRIQNNPDINRVFIACPVNVLGVWRREFLKHWAHPKREVEVYVADKGSCANKAKKIDQFLSRVGQVKVVVVNYESMWMKGLRDFLLDTHWDLVALDESHRIKSAGAKCSRFAHLLGKQAPRRMCLTGTPMPHSPLDLYGQYRFLAPHIFGTNYAAFRSQYAVTHRDFPSKVLKWVNQDDLREKFHSIRYHCASDDVLDLPPIMHDYQSFELDAKSKKAYVEIENDLVTEIEAGLITVPNALTSLLRLQQITSGFIGWRDEYDRQLTEELGTGKRKLLKDILQDVQGPVVVFCRFTHDLAVVRDLAENSGIAYGEISGNQKDLTDHAEMPDWVDVMGVQIRSGGVGIDLTRAHVGVFYSQGYSLGDYEQAVARILRPGQQRAVQIYHLLAENTVDFRVYAALKARKQVVETIIQEVRDGHQVNAGVD